MMSLIWLLGIAGVGMIVVFVVQAFRLQEQLKGIQQTVLCEVQTKHEKDRQNTRGLALKLGEGTPVNDAIHAWAEARAAIHPASAGVERWRWSAAELADWGRSEIQERSDGVRQRFTKNLVLFTAMSLVAVAIPAAWIYYRASSASPAAYAVEEDTPTHWIDKLVDTAVDRFGQPTPNAANQPAPDDGSPGEASQNAEPFDPNHKSN